MKTETIIEDKVYHIYEIRGTMSVGNRFQKQTKSVHGYGVVCGEYYVKKALNEHKAVCTMFITDTGVIFMDKTINDITIISDCTRQGEGYDMVMEIMNRNNLCIREFVDKTDTLGTIRIYHHYGIGIKDKSKLMFQNRLTGQIIHRDAFEMMELSEDRALQLYFDNGYSYCGTMPIDKESFLKSVDAMANKPFQTYSNGIWMYRHDKYGYCVTYSIGDKQSHSEISNT